MPSLLKRPASSGHVQVLAQPRTRVVAAARPADDCKDLQALSHTFGDRLLVVPLELSDSDTIQASALHRSHSALVCETTSATVNVTLQP